MYPLRRDVECEAWTYSKGRGSRVEPRVTRTLTKGTWVRLRTYGARSCSVVLPDDDGREWRIKEWDWRTEEDPVDYNHPASFEDGTRDLDGAWLRSQATRAAAILEECRMISLAPIAVRNDEKTDDRISSLLAQTTRQIENSLAACRDLAAVSRAKATKEAT